MTTEKVYILEKGELFSKKDAPYVLNILKKFTLIKQKES